MKRPLWLFVQYYISARINALLVPLTLHFGPISSMKTQQEKETSLRSSLLIFQGPNNESFDHYHISAPTLSRFFCSFLALNGLGGLLCSVNFSAKTTTYRICTYNVLAVCALHLSSKAMDR